MSQFRKFTSIESFAHVYRGQERYNERGVIPYGAKIKLHGTNAAVRVSADNTVTAQKRTSDISIDADNCGFANWVSLTHDAWAMPPARDLDTESYRGDIIYYGEWAGPGVQKGDAVCMLNKKYFFIYAVYDEISDTMIVSPDAIEATIPDLDDVVVVPYHDVYTTPINFLSAKQCDEFATLISAEVDKIGERDPFIYGIFGVEGPGEGLVLTPLCGPDGDITDGYVDAYWYNTFIFKVKTEAHSVNKTKERASKDLTVPEGVEEFVEQFVTEARCMQGLNEIAPYASPEATGSFLKWMGQDVHKESVEELAEAGLEWKDVQKYVMKASRTWWLEKCAEIL